MLVYCEILDNEITGFYNSGLTFVSVGCVWAGDGTGFSCCWADYPKVITLPFVILGLAVKLEVFTNERLFSFYPSFSIKLTNSDICWSGSP